MRHLTDEEKVLLQSIRDTDNHIRYLLSENVTNGALYCCICRRRYLHWTMEDFIKTAVCRHKEQPSDLQLTDEDGCPDLEKVFQLVSRMLSPKIRIEKHFYGYYYSDKVKIYITDEITLRLVRNPSFDDYLSIEHDSFNPDYERGIYLPLNALEDFCKYIEYLIDNYDHWLSIVKKHAGLWLKQFNYTPNPNACKLHYNDHEYGIYFEYKSYMYLLKYHKYRSVIYINDGDIQLRGISDAFEEDALLDSLRNGKPLKSLDGTEYTEEQFCKILATAIDKCGSEWITIKEVVDMM